MIITLVILAVGVLISLIVVICSPSGYHGPVPPITPTRAEEDDE